MEWHKTIQLAGRCRKCHLPGSHYLGFNWSRPGPEAEEVLTIQEFCIKGCTLENPFSFSAPSNKAKIRQRHTFAEIAAILKGLGYDLKVKAKPGCPKCGSLNYVCGHRSESHGEWMNDISEFLCCDCGFTDESTNCQNDQTDVGWVPCPFCGE